MDLILLVVRIVVGAADPVLWIVPIVAAFFSRGRGWVVLVAALIWGGVLEFARFQMMPGYHGEGVGYHLASAALNGLVVLGIASVIRRMRRPASSPAPTQNQAAPE